MLLEHGAEVRTRGSRTHAALSREARSRQRRDARRRHDAVPARRQGRRPAGDAAAARARRGSDAGADAQRHHPADGCRGPRHAPSRTRPGGYKTQEQAIEAIQLLLDRGPTSTPHATDGQTAVHGAALQGYDDVIRFLAAQGRQARRPGQQRVHAARRRARPGRRLRFLGQRRRRARGHGDVLRQLMGENATPAGPARQAAEAPAVGRYSKAPADRDPELANAGYGTHSAGAAI